MNVSSPINGGSRFNASKFEIEYSINEIMSIKASGLHQFH